MTFLAPQLCSASYKILLGISSNKNIVKEAIVMIKFTFSFIILLKGI